MKKQETLNKITNCGIVAVVRADTNEEAFKISDACVKGGVYAIEVTFTVQEADKVIKDLTSYYKNHNKVVIGAGTVLDAITARIAILAGAQYIVSPCFDEDTARLCNLYQIPYMPGCMTITEMKNALSAGADIIKLFPGNAYGPDYVKSIKGPLPQINIMPTGGVSLDNIPQWLQNGCVAVGVGGNLTEPAKSEDYEKITQLAQAYVEKVKTARGVVHS